MSECRCGPPEPGLKKYCVSYGENFIKVWAHDETEALLRATDSPFSDWDDSAFGKNYKYEVRPDD